MGKQIYKISELLYYMEWPNRTYMLRQQDEKCDYKGIQHCNKYEQEEDYQLDDHGNEEDVMRWNSNAFYWWEKRWKKRRKIGLDTSVLCVLLR